MNALVLAVGVAGLYLIAYHTYGKYIGRMIFKVDPNATCPSVALRDDVDYVPTRRSILFGHHFASIAGTGPIVGPAIGIVWGWVPALVWVVFGSILMGGVHDFGTLIVSLRNQGRSIGDIAADVVNTRVRMLFLLIIFFALLIVVALFGMVMAIVFDEFPQAVIPVWLQIPIAVWLGYMVYRRGADHRPLAVVAVTLMYATILLGSYVPFKMPEVLGFSPTAVWVVILLIYAYIASTLPVQTLLQPRDYINAHQLFIALGLLSLGVAFAHPPMVAPAVNLSPKDAPPIWPMLFLIVACGAISGFHSLVSSGTSSKQCDSEASAQSIGYGGMLLEGMLATFVLLSCGAGLGLGLVKGGQTFMGAEAFNQQYASWKAASGLTVMVAAFVHGAANMIESIGIPHKITIGIMGVFVVSFAGTTLDTSTRLQRYVVGELARVVKVPWLARRHPATMVAVVTAFVLAFSTGSSGTGALTLWPLFGSVNQLLGGLALLVVTVYLARRGSPIAYTFIPMVFMVVMTSWGMVINLRGYQTEGNWLLLAIGLVVFALEIWMVVEGVVVLRRAYGREAVPVAEPRTAG